MVGWGGGVLKLGVDVGSVETGGERSSAGKGQRTTSVMDNEYTVVLLHVEICHRFFSRPIGIE